LPWLTGHLKPRRNWPTWASIVLITHPMLWIFLHQTTNCSLELVSFLVRLRTYQLPHVKGTTYSCFFKNLLLKCNYNICYIVWIWCVQSTVLLLHLHPTEPTVLLL
jgi:hypothetical protein